MSYFYTYLGFTPILNYLGKCNKNLGLYNESLPQYKEALAIVERITGKQYPFYSTVLNNLGKLYEKLSDNDKAEKIFVECLDLARSGFGEFHPKYALANRNLAIIYKNRGDFDAALPLITKAVQIWTAYYGENHFELGTEYGNLAQIYFMNSDIERAEFYYQKSLQIIAASVGENHETFLDELHSYAICQHFMKKYEEAESSYNKALEIAKNIFGVSHPDVSKITYELANVLKDMGQWRKAIALMEEASQIQDRFIENAFSVTTESQRNRYLKDQLKSYYNYVSTIVNFGSKDTSVLEKAYEFVFRRKGMSTEYLSNINLMYLSKTNPTLNKKVAELFQVKEKIFSLSVEATRNNDDKIDRLKLRQEELEADISMNFSNSFSSLVSRKWEFEEIISALDDELVYIDFIRFPTMIKLSKDLIPLSIDFSESTYAAFIIDPQGTSRIHLVNLGSGLVIDDLIRIYRLYISKRADLDSLNALGEKLYGMLIDPLLPFINGKKKLIISPDGMLNVLPLQILPVPDRNESMIDRYELNYIAVLRDVLKYRDEKNNASSPVVVSNPNFNYQKDIDNDEEIFRYLPGTKEEGEMVGQLLNVDPLTGDNAVKQSVMQIKSPVVLHIATHGFFLELSDNAKDQHIDYYDDSSKFNKLSFLDNPLRRSGLALAGVNAWDQGFVTDPSVDNGILLAEDVSQLDLRGTQLVVLSACETGLGNIEAGEGVVGLRRSFAIAGTQGLILSLWSIPDKQTKDLIIDMYKKILRGKHCVSSLREAQMAVREQFPHPLFWGGFIYQGNYKNSIQLDYYR